MRSLAVLLVFKSKLSCHPALVPIAVASLCTALSAQTNPQRDASAVQFLTQAVQVAGGSTAVTAIQDFTASGTITQNWGNASQQVSVTVKALGTMQFRIDSTLSQGIWSLIVNNGIGEVILPNGRKSTLSYQNVINLGFLTCPSLKLSAALSDTTMTVIDMGIVPFNSGQAHQIRIQQGFPNDPTGLLSKLATQDYFFDPVTLSLLGTQDLLHPDDAASSRPLLHVTDFAQYTVSSGITVPFSIAQTVDGQTTWVIQLSSITFNTGLVSSNFQL